MLVGLSLFDDMVGVDVKSQMVASLCLPQSTNSVKRLDCPLSPSALLALPFASERTTVIFDVLQLNEKKRRRKASFQRILRNDVMILSTRTSGWQHQP